MEINITWCTEDVLHTAEEMDISLTEKEADEILLMVEKNHDACIGICWDTLRYYITEYRYYKRIDEHKSYETHLWNVFA